MGVCVVGTGGDGVCVCCGDWWRWGVCVVGTGGDAIDVGPPL